MFNIYGVTLSDAIVRFEKAIGVMMSRHSWLTRRTAALVALSRTEAKILVFISAGRLEKLAGPDGSVILNELKVGVWSGVTTRQMS